MIHSTTLLRLYGQLKNDHLIFAHQTDFRKGILHLPTVHKFSIMDDASKKTVHKKQTHMNRIGRENRCWSSPYN